MTTTTQEFIKKLRAFSIPFTGVPNFVEAEYLMKESADALEALQAEIERLNGVDADARTSAIDFRNKRKALEAERDQAIARLAELEKQEPVIYQAKTKPGFLSTSAYAWEDCEKADFLVYGADGVHVRGLYAAAGASPVEPNFCESCAMGLSTCDCVTPRPVFVNQLPSAQPSQAGLSDAEIDAIEAAGIAKLAQGVDMPEAVNNDLADDISAIDAMYRGDPTYEHDAYYMRKAAEKCVRKGYALYTADQLHTCIAAARVKALEDAALVCAAEADGRGGEDAFMARLCEKGIRALKGGAA